MKMKKFVWLMAAGVLAMTGCQKQVPEKVYTVDEVCSQFAELAGDTICFEGRCATICKHGGRKAFMPGSDGQILRVEGEQAGNFAPECVNNTIRVRGVIKTEWAGCEEGEEACDNEKFAIQSFYADAVSYEIVREE